MPESAIQFGLLAFVSLFTIVNPLGALPIFISISQGLEPRQARALALKATLTALIVLVGFALTGRLVFRFFGISTDSLRIVGGVIFFVMGYEMLQARLSRTRVDEETPAEYIEDVAITPLGIPMIAGPGAITNVILLMSSAGTPGRQAALFAALALVMVLTWVFLVAAKRVMSALGSSGNKVLMRLMGLIVMVIAVEFFFAGLKPFVRGMMR
ncbi:MAG: NAAT family transporter [Armatimonadetes bacterium]|nr:NAAT family transporter [Armatimonadota bacterium]